MGQTAVVTGASSGVGAAIARALGARGARLCLLGRRPELLQELIRPSPSDWAEGLAFRVDLAVPEQIENFAATFARDCGRADMLIHCAGVIALGSTESSRAAELDWQLKVNLYAPYLLTQALLPLLKQRQGQITFINSTAGVTAGSMSGQYAASKHGLTAIADSLRHEVNSAGVRVLSVFLGRTATPMQAAVHAFEGRPYFPEKLIQPADVAEIVVHAMSLPRTAEVTSIHIRPFAKID
jgi:NAD(P)-dependent dehydrogenase (short-subunit alcohol dehydrogenase family)